MQTISLDDCGDRWNASFVAGLNVSAGVNEGVFCAVEADGNEDPGVTAPGVTCHGDSGSFTGWRDERERLNMNNQR